MRVRCSQAVRVPVTWGVGRVLWGAALVLLCAATVMANARPNFVIVLADDLGYGDLACYGHPHLHTPHLDRLAEQGLRLNDCHSPAANCSPARTGLLTGRTPNRAGIYSWIPMFSPMHLRESEITVTRQGSSSKTARKPACRKCSSAVRESTRPTSSMTRKEIQSVRLHDLSGRLQYNSQPRCHISADSCATDTSGRCRI